MDELSQDFITVEELANYLKVNTRTIQRIVQRKEIRAVRIGRQWRFRGEWVREWLRKNTIHEALEHSA